AILGPCLVVPQEDPSVTVRSVDVVLPCSGSREEAVLVRQLRDELDVEPHDGPVAYRGGRRWARAFERVDQTAGDAVAPLRENGVYLVTGGLGDIGLILAEHLARSTQARLALLGRSGVPARAEWDAWLGTHAPDDATSQRIRRLRTVEAAGGEVMTI